MPTHKDELREMQSDACFDSERIAVGHTLVISLKRCISAISSVAIMLFFKLDMILSIA